MDLAETQGILKEFLNWMKENKVITENIFTNKKSRVKFILNEVKELKDDTTDEGLKRFLNLDDAQKSFVILAATDKRLESEKVLRQKDSSFKLIVNTSYLNQVKYFKRIRDEIRKQRPEQIKDIHIKKYLVAHPNIKKLGCGQFALNFHKHIKNIMILITGFDIEGDKF